MKNAGMSEKERALIAAARREANARGKPGVGPAAAKGVAPLAPLDGRTVIGWDHPAAHTTPLDQPTVAGWDHPAAGGGAGPQEDPRWSRISALMEAERAAAGARRRRLQRRVNIVFAAVLVVGLLIAARALLGR